MPFIARAPAARSLTTTARSPTKLLLSLRKTTSVLLTRHLPPCPLRLQQHQLLQKQQQQYRVYQTSPPCSSPSYLLLDRAASPSTPATASSTTTPTAAAPLRSSQPHSSSYYCFLSPSFLVSSAAKAMSNQQQTREHGSHSHSHGHGHHHHHDNTFLVSQNKNDAGVRITRIGLYVNLGMAISKGIGGYMFNSKALSADAMHSLTDLAADFITLASVSLALKPPSEKYPSGYSKFESLGTLGITAILVLGGWSIGYAAVMSLAEQFMPGMFEYMSQFGLGEHGHGHSHGHDHHSDLGPNINAAWLAAGSIAIKEWLYRATLKVSKERKSAVLAANAYHHRIDSLTAFVALLTIVGARYLPGANWLDPVGGLVISLMVIQAGIGNTVAAVRELADARLDPEITDKIRHAAEDALEGTKDGAAVTIRGIQGRKAGQNYMIDVEVGVPELWSVRHTSKIEEVVREGIANKVRGVKRVKVRFVPGVTEQEEGAFQDEFITISRETTPEPESHDERNGKKDK